MIHAKIGDRIRLVCMGDDPDPIPSGSEGTVDYVCPNLMSPDGRVAQIGVKWDSGRMLSLVVPPDSYEILQPVYRSPSDDQTR